jgi:hypothetical protein
MDGCLVFSGSLPEMADGKLEVLPQRPGNDQTTQARLCKADYFYQQSGVFPISSDILTPVFVAEKVKEAETRAVLGDLRQPRTKLFGAIGSTGRVQIFDQTNMIWIAQAQMKKNLNK